MRRAAFLFLIGVAVLFSVPVHAGMTGVWSAKTDARIDKSGKPVQAPDFFNLYLVSHGDLVCGSYEASAHNRNKLDFSQVIGRKNKNRVKLYFLNGHTGYDTSFGIATLEVSGRRGIWELALPPDDESYVWGTTNVTRAKFPAKLRRELEKNCASQWSRLSDLDFEKNAEVLNLLRELKDE